MSRRLRARTLLLIVPLLMASAPSTPRRPSSALTNQPDHLAFVDLPSELVILGCHEFGVELRDSTGDKTQAQTPILVKLTGTLMSGTFHTTADCSSGSVETVTIPTGATDQRVWYKPPLVGFVTFTASAAGLLDANSPQYSVVELPTATLHLDPAATDVTVGIPVTVKVTARNTLGIATGYGGTVHFNTSSTAVTPPPDYTFDPAEDKGEKPFSVIFNQAGTVELSVKDVNNGQLQSRPVTFNVQAAAATAFRVDGWPLDARAGVPITFTLYPLDASGADTTRTAHLQFSSDDPRAELPDISPSDTINLPAQFTVTFNSPSSTPRKFTITDVYNVPNVTLDKYVPVRAGLPASVKLSTALPQVPLCAKGIVRLEAFDVENNPAPEPVVVSLCRNLDRSATFESSTLSPAPAAPPPGPNCITGELRGTAQVVWTDTVEEGVDFFVESTLIAQNTLQLSWSGSGISPVNSTLQFVESSDPQPQLVSYQGKLTLKLTLNDFCGHPVPLPSNPKLSFAADAPLEVTNPPQQDPEFKNVWTTSVRLTACPTDPSLSLAVWPLIDDKPPTNVRIERRVQPKCEMPVEIKLLPSDGSRFVEPGTMADFEFEVSNSADMPFTGGVLMVSGNGLTVTGATLNGQALTKNGDGTGFMLPELRKDAPLKVTVQGQATTQPETAGQITTRFVLNGSPLSEETPANFTTEKLGVDVGCGCHSTAPASQLLPWLLLLLVGSRPLGGLRRLRRGERTDD